MTSRAVFGRAFARQSNQPMLRRYPGLDNQIFRISRGRQVPTSGQRKQGWVPIDSHWEPMSCEQAQCEYFVNGWSTTLNLTPAQDPAQLKRIQIASQFLHHSGWDFTVTWDGSEETFHFAAGQNHYQAIDQGHRHWRPITRDPIFMRIRGPQQVTAMDYDQFFDAYNENQYWLQQRLKQG